MKVQDFFIQARFIEIHQVFARKKSRRRTKVEGRLLQARFIEIHQVFAKYNILNTVGSLLFVQRK